MAVAPLDHSDTDAQEGEAARYCQIWRLKFIDHAAIWSGLVRSIPSLKLIGGITSAMKLKMAT